MHQPYVFGIIFALSFMSAVPRAHASAFPNVILSEIAWAGSAQSTADEWIELANIGTESVPLGGWQLTGVGTADAVLTIPEETHLQAGATYLVSNYAMGDPKSTLNTPSHLVTTSLSILNTSLNITLINTNGEIIDSVVDPSTPDAGSSTTYASMERVLTDLSWANAETSTNLLNSQLGSPGITGHTSALVIEEPIIAEPPETDLPINDDKAPPPEPTIEIPVADTPVVDEVAATPTEPIVEEPIVITEPVAPVEPIIEETPTDTSETTSIAPTVMIDEPIETPIIEPAVEASAAPSIVAEAAEPVDPIEPETPASSSAESADDAVATIPTGSIAITAVFPSPNAGDDEWVALTNLTGAAIDLSGATLVDASGAITLLSDTLAAYATLYVLNPSGKLNNDGDSVSLIDSTGALLSTVAYGTDEFPAPKKGIALLFSSPPIATETIDDTESQSYEESRNTTASETATATGTTSDFSHSSSRADTARTTPVAPTSTSIPATPSTPNIATRVTSTATPKKTSTKSSTASSAAKRTSSPAPTSTTIGAIDRLPDDTAVTLEGIVVSMPGTIGKRSFFLNGLEIYQSQGDLAEVTIGDRVRITGTVSVLSTHRRVNIKAGGVTILGSAQIEARTYAENLPYGSLVSVTGTVSARDGNAVILRIDDETSITIAPATGVTVDWASLAGKSITVTGILKNSGTSPTIVLRNAEDIVVAPEPLDAVVAGSTTGSAFPWIGVGTAALVAAGFGAWAWRNRPRSSLTTLTLHPTSL